MSVEKQAKKSGGFSYVVRLRRPDGREYKRSFRTKREAEVFEARERADRSCGTWIDQQLSKETFGEYAERWISMRHDLQPTTVSLWKWLLRARILPTFATVPLGKITPTAVRSWYATQAADTPPTAANAYNLLRGILKTAVADEIIRRNPCQLPGAGQVKAPLRPIAELHEVASLTNAMPGQMQLAVLLAVWCTLRRGELLGLERRDIDIVQMTLTVERTRVVLDGKLVEKGPKTEAGRRTMAIPANVIDQVRVHLMRYVAAAPCAPIFTGKEGAPLLPRELECAWHKARLQVGRPDLHFHDLRHTGCTFLARAGATTRDSMARMGHSNPTMTLHYQRSTAKWDKVVAADLAKLAEERREDEAD